MKSENDNACKEFCGLNHCDTNGCDQRERAYVEEAELLEYIPMRHVMVDLETMGTGSNAAIVSIGAVQFDINTGKTGHEFYYNIDLQSCLDAGLHVDGSTIMWWLRQSEEARMRLQSNPLHVADVVAEFSIFIQSCGPKQEVQVWGNSARFDLGKLDDVYRHYEWELPWDFRYERDVRTLVSFAPHIKEQEVRVGPHHDALADCYHQIAYCSKIWQAISPAIKFPSIT